MAQQEFIYGWCKTDHKSGEEIRRDWRSEDYVFGEKHKDSVGRALQRLGLPLPTEKQVFRGTRHDLIFIDSHGVVLRIGKQDIDDLVHPGNLQPLGWARTEDPEVSVAIYPGIEQYSHVPYKIKLDDSDLRSLMRDTGQSANDWSSNNLGIIRIEDNGKEIGVPVVLDLDNDFNGTSDPEAKAKKKSGMSEADTGGILRSRAMQHVMESVASPQLLMGYLRKAFEVHQPLRNLFWFAFNFRDDSLTRAPDADALDAFWRKCASLLSRPQNIVMHDWTQHVNENGIIVWQKQENFIPNLGLYRAWTGADKDRNYRYAYENGWAEKIQNVTDNPAHLLELSQVLQTSKRFLTRAFVANTDIAAYIRPALFDDMRFLKDLGDISLSALLPYLPQKHFQNPEYMAHIALQNLELVKDKISDEVAHSDIFIRAILTHDVDEAKEYLPEDCWKSLEFAEKFIGEYPGIYPYLDETMMAQPHIVRQALAGDADNYEYMPEDLRDIEEYLDIAMVNNKSAYHDASDRLRENIDYVQLFLKDNARGYRFIPDKFRADPIIYEKIFAESPKDFSYAPDEIKDDDAAFAIAFEKDPYVYIYASPRIKETYEFAEKFIANNPQCYNMLQEEMRADVALSRMGLAAHPHFYDYAPEEIRDNEELLLMVMPQNECAFSYASERLRSKPEIALKAIEASLENYSSIAGDLIQSHDFARQAIEVNVFVVRKFGEKMSNEADLFEYALNRAQSARDKIRVYYGVGSALERNEDFLLSMLKNHPEMYDEDPHFIGRLDNKSFLERAVRAGSLAAKSVMGKQKDDYSFVLKIAQIQGVVDDDIPQALRDDENFMRDLEKARAVRDNPLRSPARAIASRISELGGMFNRRSGAEKDAQVSVSSRAHTFWRR